MRKFLVSTVLAVVAFGSVDAYAERKNPLDGQPAVRRKVEFLKARFEITPRVGMTYLQDFKHSLLIGLAAEYHITSWLSFGFFFDYAAHSFATDLTKEIERTLPDELNRSTTVDPSPSKEIMRKALDTMTFQAGVFVAYSPWFGKLSLFGKVFASFDFYLMGGAGFAMFQAGKLLEDGCNGDIDRTGTCETSILYIDRRVDNGGFKVGPLVGFGVRFQLLQWLALHVSFNAMFIKRNSAGFDRTGDTVSSTGVTSKVVVVDKKDDSMEALMSFTIGVSFLLPHRAPRTR